MKKLLLPLMLFCASIAWGQFSSKTGNITAAASTCTGLTICVDVPFPQSNAPTVVVTVTGTWSGTLQFEATAGDPAGTFVAVSGSPLPSGATVSSTTANGTWIFDTAGLSDFHVRASSLASGTAVVTINPSSAVADATINIQPGGTVSLSQTDITGNGVEIAPTTASAAAIAPVVSASAESNHVFKASAGNLYSAYVTTGASAGLLMIFNATSAPGDGAVTPIHCIDVAANTTAGLNFAPGPPESYATGITAVFSTGTNCFNKAASATAFFHGSVK